MSINSLFLQIKAEFLLCCKKATVLKKHIKYVKIFKNKEYQ